MYRKTHKAILKHKTEMFCRCHMRTQIRISESLTVVDQRLKYITIEEHYRVEARATRLRSNFECVIHASACYPHPKSDLSRSIAFFFQHQDLKSLIFSEIQIPMLYVVNKERVWEAFVAPLVEAISYHFNVLMPAM